MYKYQCVCLAATTADPGRARHRRRADPLHLAPSSSLPTSRRGPWFSTQLVLSLGVGITSFLVFCWIRRYEKFKVLYAPRTMLKGAPRCRQLYAPSCSSAAGLPPSTWVQMASLTDRVS